MVLAVEEAENPVGIATEDYAALQDLIGCRQLLQVLRRHGVQLLYQLEHPGDLLGHLAGQRVQELGDRALSLLGPVEVDRPSHAQG